MLNNVYLPLYDTTTQSITLSVGPFGILVVETKADQGEIYGSPKDENWIQVIGKARNKHYNPLKQNKTHCDNLRHNLKKKNLYVVKIESLVVYAAKNVQLYTTGNAPVVTMKQLKKFFRQPLFRENNKVNVDKVVDTINEIRVKDQRDHRRPRGRSEADVHGDNIPKNKGGWPWLAQTGIQRQRKAAGQKGKGKPAFSHEGVGVLFCHYGFFLILGLLKVYVF